MCPTYCGKHSTYDKCNVPTTYIIVAFKHDQERSVLYRKVGSLEDIGKAISDAERRGATFVSIRIVRK